MGIMNWFTGKKSVNNAKPVDGGTWVRVGDPTMGAWQRNEEIIVSKHDQLAHYAVFSCVSLIASDVGKLKLQTKKEKNGVKQVCDSKVNKLLDKPNRHQTTQQFLEAWATSKATHGNTYVWKVRNIFNEIWQLVILNAERVKPLVSSSGEVFYQVKRDDLFNITEDIVFPASEIIHDRFNCFYHPLVGLSPIVACALSASQGVKIQRNTNQFFGNASRPSGILVAPGPISDETAKELKENWQKNYSGIRSGGTAVLGDGVEYKPIAVSAHDAQLVEQLKLSGEIVCTAFRVPAFKVGIGTLPTGVKVSDLNEIYYSDCAQHYLESIENLLKVHLEMEQGVEVEFNLKGLIRMDSTSQIEYLARGVEKSIFAPNEARKELGLMPVPGGDSPMIQQQNYSLAALAKRDAKDDPFAKDALTNNQEVTNEVGNS